MRLKYDCRRFVHFQIIVVIFGLIVMMATISRRYPSYARPEPHINSNNVVEPESILTKPEPCASKPDQYYGGPDQHNESRPDHPGGISDCPSSDQTYPPEFYPVDQPGDSEYDKPYPDGPLQRPQPPPRPCRPPCPPYTANQPLDQTEDSTLPGHQLQVGAI